jgi:hypothetical protein
VDDGYEPPPYNRCDYRCDRCGRTGDCLVFKMEEVGRLTRALCSRDPNGPDAFAEEVLESLESAESMLRKIADEKGIDLDSRANDGLDGWQSSRESAHNDPFFRDAMEACMRSVDFVKACEERVFISPEIRPLFDELMWYAPLVAAKTMRALINRGEDGAGRDDAVASAGIVGEGLARCRRAIEEIERYRPETAELSGPLRRLFEGLEARRAKAFRLDE